MSEWTDMEDALQAWVCAGTGLPENQVVWEDQGAQKGGTPYARIKLGDDEVIGQDWLANIVNARTVGFAVTSVANGTDTLTKAAHGLLTGDGPLRLTTSGTLPAGLALGTDYWAIRITASTFKLAASLVLANALTPVAFSDDGTGTTSVSSVAGETLRVGEELSQTARGPRVGKLTIQCFGKAGPGGVGDDSPLRLLGRLKTRSRLESVRALLADAGCAVLRFGKTIQVGGNMSGLFEPRAVLEVVITYVVSESEHQRTLESAELLDELTGTTLEIR